MPTLAVLRRQRSLAQSYNYDGLRGASGVSGMTVQVYGRTTANDGGEGSFIWVTGNIAAAGGDNGGTRIAGPVGSGGFWVREAKNYVDPIWFTNYVSEDTDASVAVALALAEAAPGRPLKVDRMWGLGAAAPVAILGRSDIAIVGRAPKSGFKAVGVPTQVDFAGRATLLLLGKDGATATTKCNVLHIEIDMNGIAANGIGVADTEDCRLEDIYVHDLGGSPSYLFAGIRAYRNTRNTYKRIRGFVCGFGIYAGHSTNQELFANITECEMYSCYRDGIIGNLVDSKITGNQCHNNGTAAGTSGIALTGANTTFMPARVTVTGNNCTGNSGSGFQCDVFDYTGYIDRLTLSGNEFSGNGSSGAYLVSCSNFSATGNVCTNNGVNGMTIDKALNGSVTGGVFSYNTDKGIGVNSLLDDISGVSISGVTADNNGSYGIAVANVTSSDRVDNVTVANCNAHGNATVDLFFADSHAGQMTGIKCISNNEGTLVFDTTIVGQCAHNNNGYSPGVRGASISSGAVRTLSNGDCIPVSGTATIEHIATTLVLPGHLFELESTDGFTLDHDTAAPPGGTAAIICLTGAATLVPAGTSVWLRYNGSDFIQV